MKKFFNYFGIAALIFFVSKYSYTYFQQGTPAEAIAQQTQTEQVQQEPETRLQKINRLIDQNLVSKFYIYDTETQQGKRVKGGKLISVKATVPFDISRDQIKSTTLKILKNLINYDPECYWFEMWLTPSEGLMSAFSFAVAKAEYRDGEFTILPGIPSDEQIEEYNGKIGKTFGEGLFAGQTIEGTPIVRPVKTYFNKASKVIINFYKIYKNNQPDTDEEKEEIFLSVSNNLGMSKKKVKEYYKFMHKYYSPFMWGSETLTL